MSVFQGGMTEWLRIIRIIPNLRGGVWEILVNTPYVFGIIQSEWWIIPNLKEGIWEKLVNTTDFFRDNSDGQWIIPNLEGGIWEKVEDKYGEVKVKNDNS